QRMLPLALPRFDLGMPWWPLLLVASSVPVALAEENLDLARIVARTLHRPAAGVSVDDLEVQARDALFDAATEGYGAPHGLRRFAKQRITWRIADLYRNRSVERLVEPDAPVLDALGDDFADSVVDQIADREAVRKLMSVLTPEQRQILFLQHWAD